MFGHTAEPLQATRHPHEAAQSIEVHTAPLVQAISHASEPQLTGPHTAEPVQRMSQLLAPAQSMSLQLVSLHRITQSRPAGHLMLPVQGFSALHSIRQVWSSGHDVHAPGHPADATQ
jgi:hypothetical protein